MSGWLLAGCVGLALVVAALVALPAWRRRNAVNDQLNDLAVYRDQLAELDRDRARNLIDATEAEAARIEIERRILRAASAGRRPPATASATSQGVVMLAAVLLPILTGALYWQLGQPTMADLPAVANQRPADQPDVAAMVERLEARLAANPQDLDGWLMLGRSKAALGDNDASAAAYRKALALQPESAEAQIGLAEGLIAADQGGVGAEARSLLQRADAQKSPDPRVGYYLALAAAQSGDLAGASLRWQRLLAESPADAPWREDVSNAIRRAAETFGIEDEKLAAALPTPPGAPAGPAAGQAAGQAAEIAALPPAERAARIRTMVDGLQARLEGDPSGGDVEGWARLAQARSVLGERDAALTAWDRALAIGPATPELLLGKVRVLLEPTAEGQLPRVPDPAVPLLHQAEKLAPANAETQWYLGIRALQDQRSADARTHWERALAAIDPSDADYAAMKERLADLDGKPPATP